jgi:hypothetical protein
MIESGDDNNKIGKHGEVSRYQIMPAVWMAHIRWPTLSTNPQMSTYVAELILKRRIADHFPKRNPTPREIYILWNAPAQIKKPSKKVLERAIRFENLYNEKMKGVR